jgi:NADH-quinone oxidoreductase subunit N
MRSHPLLALSLGLALLTLAGLPPGIAGLVAKVVALRPVVGDGTWWLAVVAAVNVAIGIAVYLRWFAVLLSAPASSGPATATASSPAEQEPGADEPEGAPVDRPDGRARHTPVAIWALVGVLTALLVLGSITPVGVV